MHFCKFLNLKESENGFRISLLNRSIQDLADHGASKDSKNPLPEWILLVPMMRHDLRDLGLIFWILLELRI